MRTGSVAVLAFAWIGTAIASGGIVDVRQQLDSITIPEFKIEAATLEEAVDQLRALSKAHDRSGRHESVLGVKFAVEQTERPHARLISLDLEGSTVASIVNAIADAAGRRADVGAEGVSFVVSSPGKRDPDAMFLRLFRVPSFHSAGDDHALQEPLFREPDPKQPGGAVSAKEILERNGIGFPEGASARFDGGRSILFVKNNEGNMEMVEAFVEQMQWAGFNRVEVRVEIYGIDLTTAAKFAGERSRGRPDGDVLRELREMCADGRASMDASPSITTRSGQRAKLEAGAGRNIICGYELKDGKDVPVIERMPLGTMLEVDPLVGADQRTIELNIAIEHTYGEPVITERTIVLPASGKKAVVNSYEMPTVILSTSTTVDAGRMSYLGMVEQSGDDGVGKALLMFVGGKAIPRGDDLPDPE